MRNDSMKTLGRSSYVFEVGATTRSKFSCLEQARQSKSKKVQVILDEEKY